MVTYLDCHGFAVAHTAGFGDFMRRIVLSSEIGRLQAAGELPTSLAELTPETMPNPAALLAGFHGFNLTHTLNELSTDFSSLPGSSALGVTQPYFQDMGVSVMEKAVEFSPTSLSEWASLVTSAIGVPVPMLTNDSDAIVERLRAGMHLLQEVTEANLRLVLGEVFDAADRDANGKVSMTEFSALLVSGGT